LDTLALDPFALVRQGAERAREMQRRSADARRRTRLLFWCAMRDDDAAALVYETIRSDETPPPLRAGEVRRAQRMIARLHFGPRALGWLEGIERARSSIADERLAATSTLTATDGRSIEVTLAWEERIDGPPNLARIREGIGARTESHDYAVQFIHTAPSRFM